MSEMDRACVDLRIAISNPYAVARYLEHEKQMKELWKNFRKGGKK